MFTKVLIATDLSAASLCVVRCAQALKPLGTKECLLLQCIPVQQAASAAVAQDRAVLEGLLAEQTNILKKSGFAVQADFVLGHPQTEINRTARERNCSLIIIGSHGHTLLGEMFLGGVAAAIIHHAAKPVLILRVKRKEDGKGVCVSDPCCDFLRHVLFATDFSDHADHAFRYAERIAAAGARRMMLLHVQDKTRIDPHLMHRLEEFNRIDRDRLEKMKQRIEAAGCGQVECRIPYGNPVQEILKASGADGVSLTVLGSQGRGFIPEVVLGSVSHQIARQAQTPVLLVPAAR